jgi:hypothetical protein
MLNPFDASIYGLVVFVRVLSCGKFLSRSNSSTERGFRELFIAQYHSLQTIHTHQRSNGLLIYLISKIWR